MRKSVNIYVCGFLSVILLTAAAILFFIGIFEKNILLSLICGFIAGFNGLQVYNYFKLIKEKERN